MKKCKYVPTIDCTTNEPCGNWCEVYQDAHRMTEPKAGATPEAADRELAEKVLEALILGGYALMNGPREIQSDPCCPVDLEQRRKEAIDCYKNKGDIGDGWINTDASFFYHVIQTQMSLITAPIALDRAVAKHNGGTAKEWYDMMQEIDKRGSEWKAKAAKQADVIEACRVALDGDRKAMTDLVRQHRALCNCEFCRDILLALGVTADALAMIAALEVE